MANGARRSRAWHLRQDGEAYPVEFHFYSMNDSDLSSEAEIASFLIFTNSKDLELAKYVLDAWMALMLEEEMDDDMSIDEGIHEYVRDYIEEIECPYWISINDMAAIHRSLNNYNDIDSLYEFCNKVRSELSNLQRQISQSLNQQFCRVRLGGRYDTESGNNEIWFRISSVNYNWLNTIYTFLSNKGRGLKISTINICRDAESDEAYTGQRDEDVFYKAKDGSWYRDMPIKEFMSEEHGKNPVFSSTNIGRGALATIRGELSNGCTYLEACTTVDAVPGNRHVKWQYFLNQEILTNCI